jgi:hypothetical protein
MAKQPFSSVGAHRCQGMSDLFVYSAAVGVGATNELGSYVASVAPMPPRGIAVGSTWERGRFFGEVR